MEDIESELHSAAIDTEVYEKEAAERAAHEKERSLQIETTDKVLAQTIKYYNNLHFKNNIYRCI